ncbi:MAG: hypothetical protein ABSA93_32795 [Streptosporangiaceae bacterium]
MPELLDRFGIQFRDAALSGIVGAVLGNMLTEPLATEREQERACAACACADSEAGLDRLDPQGGIILGDRQQHHRCDSGKS